MTVLADQWFAEYRGPIGGTELLYLALKPTGGVQRAKTVDPQLNLDTVWLRMMIEQQKSPSL